MRVLVTGGTGVVGRTLITTLLQRGHSVRLLSRHADRDAAQWAHGVHPVPGDVAVPSLVAGAADGCEAVLHLTSIVDDSGEQTLDRVNVDGTRNVVQEAERAGAQKFVYVSSLGAEVGESPYHQSKRRAEAIVRQFRGAWTIVRPGSVYGPGDEQISLLLRMIRTMPVLPTLGDGDQRFQPIWHEDLAEALAIAVERDDLAGKELDIAGPGITSQKDLIRRLSTLTQRAVPLVTVPEFLMRMATRAASALGVDVPFSDSQMQMLAEGSVIRQGRENALTATFGLPGTTLDEGLRRLVNAQEEQMPDTGVGALRRKRYRADISASAMTPEQLMEHVSRNFSELMTSFVAAPAESGSAFTLREGATLTLSLPVRGHIQVRVEEVAPRVITLVTLAGHPLSGAVRFLSEARGDDLRFEVQVYDRAASVLDFLAMRAIGDRLQDAAWREMVGKVVDASGGVAPAGVTQESDTLDEAQAERVEEWVRKLVNERRQAEAGV